MRKLGYILLLMMIFSCILAGNVYANTAGDLIEWDQDYCESSDDPDIPDNIDSMDPGNPNSDDAMDIGSLDIIDVTADTITCVIANAYPGYQADIYTSIINITKNPVKITSIRVKDKPDCILVSLKDSDGKELIGDSLILNKDSSMDVVLTTRVLQSARQAASYEFTIIVEARQDSDDEGGGDGGGDSDNPGDAEDDPEEVVNQEDIPTTEPQEPQITSSPIEPISLPINLPELPYTGGNLFLFIGSGAALGGLGFVFKRVRNRK